MISEAIKEIRDTVETLDLNEDWESTDSLKYMAKFYREMLLQTCDLLTEGLDATLIASRLAMKCPKFGS